MVASWRVKCGFLGWRMAQTRKIINRRVKVKIRRPLKHRLIIIRCSSWSSVHLSPAMILVVAVVLVDDVVVEGGVELLRG